MRPRRPAARLEPAPEALGQQRRLGGIFAFRLRHRRGVTRKGRMVTSRIRPRDHGTPSFSGLPDPQMSASRSSLPPLGEAEWRGGGGGGGGGAGGGGGGGEGGGGAGRATTPAPSRRRNAPGEDPPPPPRLFRGGPPPPPPPPPGGGGGGGAPPPRGGFGPGRPPPPLASRAGERGGACRRPSMSECRSPFGRGQGEGEGIRASLIPARARRERRCGSDRQAPAAARRASCA